MVFKYANNKIKIRYSTYLRIPWGENPIEVSFYACITLCKHVTKQNKK